MKKTTATLLALALALSLGIAACSGQTATTENAAGSEATATTDDEPIMGVANPWTEYATLDEAEEAAGFGIAVPGSVKGYDDVLIQVMKATTTDEDGNKADEIILEYRFMNGADDVNIRKGKVSGDISGVYGEYKESTADVNGNAVTVSSEGELAYVATWAAGGYSYSVSASAGMAEADLLDIVADVA